MAERRELASDRRGTFHATAENVALELVQQRFDLSSHDASIRVGVAPAGHNAPAGATVAQNVGATSPVPEMTDTDVV